MSQSRDECLMHGSFNFIIPFEIKDNSSNENKTTTIESFEHNTHFTWAANKIQKSV